mmetsp:Transcript_23519/g.56143  ORF Transcript_23519/g.56143 Transcript_23519/m.56143 type:complete len:237 (-) Transcript_23519:294-1004(-)
MIEVGVDHRLVLRRAFVPPPRVHPRYHQRLRDREGEEKGRGPGSHAGNQPLSDAHLHSKPEHSIMRADLELGHDLLVHVKLHERQQLREPRGREFVALQLPIHRLRPTHVHLQQLPRPLDSNVVGDLNGGEEDVRDVALAADVAEHEAHREGRRTVRVRDVAQRTPLRAGPLLAGDSQPLFSLFLDASEVWAHAAADAHPHALPLMKRHQLGHIEDGSSARCREQAHPFLRDGCRL